ncbi:MAG TPA: hypothetical protein VGC87_02510 [Pyrinomonadaceae bacterium]|jgi:hypothetical protein
MTHEELIREIMQLPLEQRIELLEAISRSVTEETRPQERRASAASRLRGIAKVDDQSAMQTSGEDGVSLSQRLYGILKYSPADFLNQLTSPQE